MFTSISFVAIKFVPVCMSKERERERERVLLAKKRGREEEQQDRKECEVSRASKSSFAHYQIRNYLFFLLFIVPTQQ